MPAVFGRVDADALVHLHVVSERNLFLNWVASCYRTDLCMGGGAYYHPIRPALKNPGCH